MTGCELNMLWVQMACFWGRTEKNKCEVSRPSKISDTLTHWIGSPAITAHAQKDLPCCQQRVGSSAGTLMLLTNKRDPIQSGAEVTSIFCDHYRVVAGKPMRGGHIIVTSTQYSYGIYPKTCCSKKVGISIFLCKVAHALISQNQN